MKSETFKLRINMNLKKKNKKPHIYVILSSHLMLFKQERQQH